VDDEKVEITLMGSEHKIKEGRRESYIGDKGRKQGMKKQEYH
jgi:hypothetical protein